MAGLQGFIINDERLESSIPYRLDLYFQITAGAATLIHTKNLPPVIFGTTAGAFTQAAVNALLSPDTAGDEIAAASTAEIDTTVAFGSTAMGTDSFGFVVPTGNQVDRVLGMEATLFLASPVIKYVSRVTSLPNTLTEGIYVTPNGNLAGRVIPTGLDAGTGVLKLSILFWSK